MAKDTEEILEKAAEELLAAKLYHEGELARIKKALKAFREFGINTDGA